MTTILLIVLALTFVGTVVLSLAQRRSASPAVAYSVVWLFVVSIHLSGVMGYYELHAPALLAIILGSVTFLLGVWLTTRSSAATDTTGRPVPPVAVPAEWIPAVTLVVALCGTAWVSVQLHGTVNVLQAWADGTVDRSMLLLQFASQLEEGSRVSAVLGTSSVLLSLCQVWAAVHLAQRRRRPSGAGDLLVVGTALVTGFAALTMAAKAPIIGFASHAAIAAAFLQDGNRVGFMRTGTLLKLASIAVIVAGSWMLNARQNEIRGTVTTLADERADLHPVVFSTLLYVSAPMTAFSEDWKVEGVGGASLGVAHTLAPVSKWLGRLGLRSDVEQTVYKEYIHTPYYINTYTWFYSFGRDAGLIGIAVFPLAIGLVAGSLYSAASRRRDFAAVAAYLMIAHAIVLSFFAWSLVATSQFVVIGALVFLSRRSRAAEARPRLWRVASGDAYLVAR